MIVVDEERIRRLLVIIGVLLMVAKVGYWLALASRGFDPAGFTRERIPLANIEWFVPASSTVEVRQLPAVNGGIREEVHARSVFGNATWGVVSLFLEDKRTPADVKMAFDLFSELQTQANNRCMVGVGADDAVEALVVKHRGRQWIVYARYPKQGAAGGSTTRHRFFRNVFVYDDDGRRWPLVTDADIEGCEEARATMMMQAMRRP